VSADRLREIASLVEASQRRLSPERAFALLRACSELLRAVPRQGKLL
jgi:hypothetical protein